MTQREAAIADRWRARVRRTIAPWGSRKQSRLQRPSTIATNSFLSVSYNKNKRSTNKHMQTSGRPTATQTDNIHTYKQAVGRPPHTKTNTYKQAVGRPLHTNTISTDTKASWGACKQAVGRPLQIKTRPTDTNKLGGTILFTKSFQAWDDDLARFAENRPPKLDNNVWLTFGAFQDVVAMNLCIISYDLPTPAHASTAWNNLKILAPAIPWCQTQCIASVV